MQRTKNTVFDVKRCLPCPETGLMDQNFHHILSMASEPSSPAALGESLLFPWKGDYPA